MTYKDLGGEVFSKCTEERDSSRFWSGMMVFWALPKQISTLNRRKVIKNWQTDIHKFFLKKTSNNSDLH
jgi:hypothetical protein